MIPQMMICPDDPPTLREDILDRRTADRGRNAVAVPLLRARLDALERALLHMHEVGPYEVRQMLIDIAAAAEQWASTLPEPRVLTLRQQERRKAAA